MALDHEEVALRARERITEQGEGDAGFTVARLMTMVNDARAKLVEMLAAENGGQYVYTKTFTIDAAGGVASLSAALRDASEPLIDDPEALAQFKVYIDGATDQLRRFPDRAGLRLDTRKVPAFALEDENLYIKGVDGKLDRYGAAVYVSGPHIPALPNIRAKHVDKLIDTVVLIALATVKQVKPTRSTKPAAAGNNS